MKKNKVMKNIENLYLGQNLEYNITFAKAKALLSIYRSVVWQVSFSACSMVCECSNTYGKELETALVYLYEFAPEKMKDNFEQKVKNLFETKWLIDVVDECINKIRGYPDYGEDYYNILYYAFLSEDNNIDNFCMSKCKLERTTYYKRKREAIALMGYMLWGYSLPNLIENIKEEKIKSRGELIC